jgi:hypothetical protein
MLMSAGLASPAQVVAPPTRWPGPGPAGAGSPAAGPLDALPPMTGGTPGPAAAPVDADAEGPATPQWPSVGARPARASEASDRDHEHERGRAGERQRRAHEAIEAQRTAARRAARAHLPSPAEVARDIALALFEVEAGRRSAAQLERVCSPELWDTLEHRVRRHGGLLPRMSDLLRVHFQELMPGLASTVALVQRGARVQPVAMRLDACSGRWLVTELRY